MNRQVAREVERDVERQVVIERQVPRDVEREVKCITSALILLLTACHTHAQLIAQRHVPRIFPVRVYGPSHA